MLRTVNLVTFIEQYKLYKPGALVHAILGILLPKDGTVLRLDFYELAYEKMVSAHDAEGLLQNLLAVLPSFCEYERESQYVIKVMNTERGKRINELTQLQQIAFDMLRSQNTQLVHTACQQMTEKERTAFNEFLMYMKIGQGN
jgi:hypothetical protein